MGFFTIFTIIATTLAWRWRRDRAALRKLPELDPLPPTKPADVHLLDTVVLLEPQAGFPAGSVGVVVELYATAVEVEFVDATGASVNGTTYAVPRTAVAALTTEGAARPRVVGDVRQMS